MESSGLSSTVSVFCSFCVRQKLPEAAKKPSNRLQTLPHAQASEGLPLCGFLRRPRGARPRAAQRPKHQLAAGLSPQDYGYFDNRPLPERETDRQTEGRKGQASASSFPAPRQGNPRLKAADQYPKASICLANTLVVIAQAGREGPGNPFFWQDLFPTGNNGSILFT